MLFSSLFHGIFAQIEENFNDEDAAETITEIKASVSNIIKKSKQYFPPLISCIQVSKVYHSEYTYKFSDNIGSI